MTPQEPTHEWWWIDYLEDELTPELDRDLRFLLEQSADDRQSFESFRLLREWLRASDPVAKMPLEASSRAIRSRVMRAIENEKEQVRNYSLNAPTKDLSV